MSEHIRRLFVHNVMCALNAAFSAPDAPGQVRYRQGGNGWRVCQARLLHEWCRRPLSAILHHERGPSLQATHPSRSVGTWIYICLENTGWSPARAGGLRASPRLVAHIRL
jgi:hypothetical protein